VAGFALFKANAIALEMCDQLVEIANQHCKMAGRRRVGFAGHIQM